MHVCPFFSWGGGGQAPKVQTKKGQILNLVSCELSDTSTQCGQKCCRKNLLFLNLVSWCLSDTSTQFGQKKCPKNELFLFKLIRSKFMKSVENIRHVGKFFLDMSNNLSRNGNTISYKLRIDTLLLNIKQDVVKL